MPEPSSGKEDVEETENLFATRYLRACVGCSVVWAKDSIGTHVDGSGGSVLGVLFPC
jgi:hypothetical protein